MKPTAKEKQNRAAGRPAEVQGGKTRRLYAGDDDWQWLTDLGDGEPSAGLRKAREALRKADGGPPL